MAVPMSVVVSADTAQTGLDSTSHPLLLLLPLKWPILGWLLSCTLEKDSSNQRPQEPLRMNSRAPFHQCSTLWPFRQSKSPPPCFSAPAINSLYGPNKMRWKNQRRNIRAKNKGSQRLHAPGSSSSPSRVMISIVLTCRILFRREREEKFDFRSF